jgi:hypothetical protein
MIYMGYKNIHNFVTAVNILLTWLIKSWLEKCPNFQNKIPFHFLQLHNSCTQFIYSNRNFYLAIALCSSLLHSAIAI